MRTRDPLIELMSVLTGRGSYEVEFPDGNITLMSWEALHVELRDRDPKIYNLVKYRWIREPD
jgi:hypothetical protein